MTLADNRQCAATDSVLPAAPVKTRHASGLGSARRSPPAEPRKRARVAEPPPRSPPSAKEAAEESEDAETEPEPKPVVLSPGGRPRRRRVEPSALRDMHREDADNGAAARCCSRVLLNWPPGRRVASERGPAAWLCALLVSLMMCSAMLITCWRLTANQLRIS